MKTNKNLEGLADGMDKVILDIGKRKQLPEEPYCGPITYCAISGTSQEEVVRLHERAMLSPSVGFFYLSFNMLDSKAKTYAEIGGSLLEGSDDRCFDTMWDFEKGIQEKNGLTKEEFVKMTNEHAGDIHSKHKANITLKSVITPEESRRIIDEGLSSKRPVAVLVMQDLNPYLNKSGRFMIPHWVTVHGKRDNEYLVFNSYDGESKWMSHRELQMGIDQTRNYHFAPQFAVVSK